MFTPEGYWSWTEIIEAVSSWTNDLILATRYPSAVHQLVDASTFEIERFLRESLLKDGFAENPVELRFALGVSELWVLANFLDTFDASLCSPTGMTMRCPPQVIAHGDALDWWPFPPTFEKFGRGETSRYLSYFRDGNFRLRDARSRFHAIDFESGKIKLKANSIQLFYTSSYGHGAVNEEEAKAFIEEHVRPFVGCTVCWNPKNIPDTRIELYKALGFAKVDWKQFELKAPGNTGGKQPSQNIIECVEFAFPDGKGDSTWNTVEQKVGYSRRSIVRALKENGSWNEWINGGGQS